MMKLNDEYFDKSAAKIIEEGEPDDLAKFMLSGGEPIEAVQRYFNDLEADKKKKLTLKGNEWFLGDPLEKAKKYTGLPLFKLFASSIIPFVENLYIYNTHLEDYSFLRDIKHLEELWLEFADEEHTKVLPALSNLQTVNRLTLDIKGLNIQLLSSLPFSFESLDAKHFVFEADFNCNKIFQATNVHLYGDEELKNDFVFTRENYQNYFAIFPHASRFRFEFFIKVIDDVSDLMTVDDCYYDGEVGAHSRFTGVHYHFFDFTGYPDSKVIQMLQSDENWSVNRCPFEEAYTFKNRMQVTCHFPMVRPAIGNRLAERSLRRIPENSNGKPEDYYRLTLQNDWGQKAEFEVLKTASAESLLEAYGEIAGLDHKRLRLEIHGGVYYSEAENCYIFSYGTVADNFKDGGVVFINLFY